MENPTTLKWHQKPTNIILLLVFFFPLGLYFMWKNGVWSSKVRWGVTALFLVLVVGGVNDKEEVAAEKEAFVYENGIGTIKHYTAKDWDKDAMIKNMGEKVWKFSCEHPDAKKLNLDIIDECKDEKGNKTNFEWSLSFNNSEIKEYSEYKDVVSFNNNCFQFDEKIRKEWWPCGNHPTHY